MDAPRTHDRTGRLLRRYQILEVLRASIQSRNGNSPSERQLLDELRRRSIKISYGALRVHLMQLQADGAIDRLDDGTIILAST